MSLNMAFPQQDTAASYSHYNQTGQEPWACLLFTKTDQTILPLEQFYIKSPENNQLSWAIFKWGKNHRSHSSDPLASMQESNTSRLTD